MELNFRYMPWIYDAVKEFEKGDYRHIPGVVVMRGLTDISDLSGRPENAPDIVTKPIVMDEKAFNECFSGSFASSYFIEDGLLSGHGTAALMNYGRLTVFPVKGKVFSLVLLNDGLQKRIEAYARQD